MTPPDSIIDRLGIPVALITLLHTADGQPYQRFQPQKVTAAAELLELTVRGDVTVEDKDIVAPRVPTDGPAWRDQVTADLARSCARSGSINIATWLRLRRQALKVQQDAAVDAGALCPGRGRLFGLIPYRKRVPDPAVRSTVIAELTQDSTAPSERTAALAGLVRGAKIDTVLDLDDAQRSALANIATGPGSKLSASMNAAKATNAALATVLYLQITGD
ncbi:GPP34 family phosphoprotein [Microbacterium sp.]|uniref:GPP34 family phosphoprotein n=1 Tax=Microbacterium sp. TaxID=51671 RepID=UPI003F98A2C2